MKVLSIVGARPQFIKAAVVSRTIREKGSREVLVHTDQHYDFNMSEIFFRQLSLPQPDYHLHVGSGSHGEQTGKMLIEVEKILLQERPDVVLIYGDTNTTLAGALAAVKLHITLAHVEAGLRSYNKNMPEEINRIVADDCADILFCPTETAVKNLQKQGFTNVINNGKLMQEGFRPCLSAQRSSHVILNVGDVMFDVALQAKASIGDKANGILQKYSLLSKNYILATIHRAGNTDNRENLKNIVEAMAQIGKNGPRIFFPAHPRTKKALEKFDLLSDKFKSLVRINEPVSYTEMIALESNAKLIITDSGGVQKEAYFFRVPCIVPRGETEWTQLVETGWNKLAGTRKASIVKAVQDSLNENFENKKWSEFYGDGKASDRIVNILQNYRKA